MGVLRYSFSKYWELSRTLRKRQALIVLLNLIVSYLNVRFALMLRDTINSPNTSRILILGGFLVLINALSFVVTYLLDVSKRAMQVEIIGRIYEKILHAKEETFRVKTPGEYHGPGFKRRLRQLTLGSPYTRSGRERCELWGLFNSPLPP